MKLQKRSGEQVTFDRRKIEAALEKANTSVEPVDGVTSDEIKAIALDIENKCEKIGHIPHVEEVQDMVENELIARDKARLVRNYITYRYKHELLRKANSTDGKIMSLLAHTNEEANKENANKNPQIASVMRDYMAGEVSRDLSERLLLPEDIVQAHRDGIIHFHDTDYYAQPIHNCDLVNLEDMLQNGTVITGTLIEKPHLFSTACNIATQIIAQVASSQYGGQTITLSHLAPFVNESRKRFRQHVLKELENAGVEFTDEQVRKITECRVLKDIEKGVQIIQYQVITLMTTNGQAPFLSVCMYLGEVSDPQTKSDLALIIEEVLKQRYQGVKNAKGVYITPAFPKLLYITEDDNIYAGSKYFYLTELAAKCMAKRMTPDIISEKKMLELKKDSNGVGHCYPCMGCRSFLTADLVDGKPKFYGRFNQGVVTINLVDVALSSKQKMEDFWKIFDERLDMCYRALMLRHERLKGTVSDVAPILWQFGALARLKPGETIDKLLYGGYSTISLGYAGLYECVKYMTGYSHTEEGGKDFALSVMRHMNDKCAEWRKKESIAFSLYGTPMESTTYKFAKNLQRRFGIIPGITDHGYITNSYHVNVREHIDAFTKLKFESEFQELSPGGAISYVEVPNMQHNLPAVIALIQFIHENIMYAEINTKSDYCHVCGWDGEIKIEEDDGKLIWKCPNCGNTDQTKMNVARRTCGYIGSQWWNDGRTEEIRDRVMHL